MFETKIIALLIFITLHGKVDFIDPKHGFLTLYINIRGLKFKSLRREYDLLLIPRLFMTPSGSVKIFQIIKKRFTIFSGIFIETSTK